MKRIYKFLFIISFFTSIIIQDGDFSTGDTTQRYQITKSLWTDEPQIDTLNFPFGLLGRNGERHYWFGVGQSLVMIPSDIVAKYFVDIFDLQEPLYSKVRIALVCYLTFPILTALAVTVSFKVLVLLGFSLLQSTVGSLSLLFCTSLLPYTQINHENNLIVLLTLLSLFFILKWIKYQNNHYLFLSYFFMGFNFLTRLTTIFDFLMISTFVFLYYLINFRSGIISKSVLIKKIRDVFTIAFPTCLLFVFFERWYNWSRFGTWTRTYQSILDEQVPGLFQAIDHYGGFFTQLLNFLFNSDFSIFLYDPLLILLMFVVVLKFKNFDFQLKVLVSSIIIFLFAYIIFYSFQPFRISCWGNRYLMGCINICTLFALPLSLKFSNRIISIKWIVVFFALLVQLLSITKHFRLEILQQRESLDHLPVLYLRFLNLFNFSISDYQEAGLSYSIIAEREITLNFMPFLVSKYFPYYIQNTILFIWFGLLLFVLINLFFLFHHLRKSY